MRALLLAVLVMPALLAQDARVKHEGDVWILETAKVQRTIALRDGRLWTSSWKDKTTGRELLAAVAPDELAQGGGEWKLVSATEQKIGEGALQFNLTVRREGLEATKSYVIYSGSSIVREWVRFKNAGREPVKIDEPVFLNVAVGLGSLKSVDLHWMTGGDNRPGSWVLKTEALQAGIARKFDSYDPFPGVANIKYRYKMGSATYAPWNALFDHASGQGLFIGFDYMGHWASSFMPSADGSVAIQFKVAGHHQTLAAGESLTTPKAFMGLYANDLDNAGNECLDWQYRYMWDYTRPGWFPAIRMLGYWWNGTPWKDPGNTWVGGNGDQDSAFRKVFRVADLMSQVGADVYHRDWGWWDRAGDWGGPDFKSMGAYLGKRGMGQLIYAFIYTVDKKSKVAREHPEWALQETLDMSKPAVVEYLKNQLDEFAKRFGAFEWRNDSVPTARHGTDDTPLLGQDQGLREILRNFLDKHPDCAFQGVNGGGNETGYDYARYASSISFSDGEVGVIRNHWASLLLPPDKTSDIPDVWQPDKYDKSTWRGLLTINFDMTGDTWDPAKLEGLRDLIDTYHYLGSQGVVGRWVRVYRPRVEGDDATMYFERLSRDGNRGIIIPKRTAPGAITVLPKGLRPAARYLVSFRESDQTYQRRGSDLMKAGIHLDKMLPGELIYLNLPYHPGSKLFKTPPTAPTEVRKQPATGMSYPGIELTWRAGRDRQWVSYFEVLRNGSVIDKVAKGTYYFDHSAGADMAATYAVRTVNGGGLRSGEAPAAGPQTKPSVILDDAPGGGITFSGDWRREDKLQPAYAGTLARSDQKGASFEFPATGSRFIWFTRLCNECGRAEVAIDGQREAVMDTYSADDIFGVGLFAKSFVDGRAHRVKITVLGEHGGPRGKGMLVYLDGIRIER